MDLHNFHADFTSPFCLSRPLSPLLDWVWTSSFHHTMPSRVHGIDAERRGYTVGCLLKTRVIRWIRGMDRYVDSAPACHSSTLGSAIAPNT
jgi:hypothetical protein